MVNGGSATSFTIHNPSSSDTINVAVQLFSPNGSALADQQVELLPGETQTVVFGDAQEVLTRGWAELKSDDEFIATEQTQFIVRGENMAGQEPVSEKMVTARGIGADHPKDDQTFPSYGAAKPTSSMISTPSGLRSNWNRITLNALSSNREGSPSRADRGISKVWRVGSHFFP